jgi:hypothetical protein
MYPGAEIPLQIIYSTEWREYVQRQVQQDGPERRARRSCRLALPMAHMAAQRGPAELPPQRVYQDTAHDDSHAKHHRQRDEPTPQADGCEVTPSHTTDEHAGSECGRLTSQSL